MEFTIIASIVTVLALLVITIERADWWLRRQQKRKLAGVDLPYFMVPMKAENVPEEWQQAACTNTYEPGDMNLAFNAAFNALDDAKRTQLKADIYDTEDA